MVLGIALTSMPTCSTCHSFKGAQGEREVTLGVGESIWGEGGGVIWGVGDRIGG